ncbi:helix-turn-helix transcriptional regulator [Mycobacterium sp. M26]|uniref:helix-turn-helix transcriptional regulator n=1 Tax=Mycobacterium sp. M26 TaxID=1762962 RepID=UPI00073F2C9B|nr:helix-turn-helix transcriptional regulator [Mycobacterium sp. M26]
MTAVLESPPHSSTCTTADPEAVAEFIGSAHGIRGRVEGLRGERPVTLSHVVMGPVSLCTARIPGELTFDADPAPCFVVTHLKSGTMQLGSDPHADTCVAGDVVLAIRPGRPCRAHLVDAEVSLTALTPAALADITGDLDRGPVRFTSGRPRSAAAVSQWQTAVDYVTTTLEDRVGVGGSEVVVGGAVRLLAATMLQVFPNTYADAVDHAVDTLDTSPPLLRRAIEFMHANCTRDIGMTDVARALNVTPRAVQYMFRRHLDISPMTYLRQIRLRRAHRDLMAGDPARDTVAAIAIRWGFAHTGRFSQAYRAEFGQSPSVTLRG